MDETTVRNDIFEPGDLTALVCVDKQEIQEIVTDQLASIDYKIHVGLYADDIALKLRSFSYDIVVIEENFNNYELNENPILRESFLLPPDQRRQQYFVLVGDSLSTNDEMLAFIYSVDLVFNVSDLTNLKPVLRRGVARHREFYTPLNETIKTVGL